MNRPLLVGLRLALAVMASAGVAGAQVKRPPDFQIPKQETSPGAVTFSHTQHAAVPKCTTCHMQDFKMKRGASGPITLEAKQQGKYCGRCHDGKAQVGGKTVFSVDECDRCHKEGAALPARPASTKGPPRRAKAEALTAQDCLACHAERDVDRSRPRPGRKASVFVDPAAYARSTHASLDCVACHEGATLTHGPRVPAVRCAGCHQEQATVLAGGVHGTTAAARQGVTCTSCHGTHDVRRAAAIGAELCASCHAKQATVYQESIHARSRARGNAEAATCRHCHGATHALLPRTDARAPTYHLNLPRACAQCHADRELARRHGISVENAYQLYMDSIHGRALTRSGLLVAANCSDCHGVHDIKPRADADSRVSRGKIAETCGGCHAGVLKDYRVSIHGTRAAAGNPVAPVCIDCHSAHQIRRVEAEAWKLDIVKECGTCHVESLRTYRDTFHGKVSALGFTRVARCSDCHGAHTVQPARDSRSTVHATNVVETCRKCHPSANANFTRYDPHADPENPERDRSLYVSQKFMRWLLVGTFSFFGIHTGLWGMRSLLGRRRRPAPREDRVDE